MSKPSNPNSDPQVESLLTPDEEAQLANLLVNAYRPRPLDSHLNDELIDAALEDPLAPPTPEEIAESERFRRALEGHGDHPDLALAQALTALDRGGADPGHLQINEAALERALPRGAAPSASGSSNIVVVSFGALAALAAAAALLLLLAPPDAAERVASKAEAPAAVPGAPSLAQSRSSTSLFDANFERERTTERVDRIASVRTRELRANRFKQWGIQ